MKIYDCTTFYSEHMMYDIRLNILNEHVHKFIVTEATYSHSGQPKKLNFDINNYNKFKDKIIYIVIDKEPNNIERIENKNIIIGGDFNVIPEEIDVYDYKKYVDKMDDRLEIDERIMKEQFLT